MGPETDFADGGGDVFHYVYAVCDGEEYQDVGGGEGIAGDGGWRVDIVGEYYFE